MNNMHLSRPTGSAVLGNAASQTLAIVLAGGRGERLHGLTDRQAKPALYFGGKFRMIDFPLSNCVNSEIRRIAVATQYRAHELIHHVQRTWSFLRPELSEFVELWPAQQRDSATGWYAGTADAIYQNIEMIRRHAPRYVLILAGDHVYKQDYRLLLRDHIECDADITISCIEVPREEGRRFGVMNVDESDTIVSFLEKPASPPGLADAPDRCLASTGIYIFNTDVLLAVLQADAENANSRHDFGGDIIPKLVSRYRVVAHRFSHSCVSKSDNHQAYWRDVGTLDAYWHANMDMVRTPEVLNLYDSNWRIWTLQDSGPPVRFISDGLGNSATISNCVVGHSCVVGSALLRDSVLSHRIRVAEGARITDSVILPGCEIGAGARLHRCIVADDCKIPTGLIVGEDIDTDREWFHCTNTGVTMITPDMLIRFSRQRAPAARNNVVEQTARLFTRFTQPDPELRSALH